jgi:hypothetical protein
MTDTKRHAESLPRPVLSTAESIRRVNEYMADIRLVVEERAFALAKGNASKNPGFTGYDAVDAAHVDSPMSELVSNIGDIKGVASELRTKFADARGRL